MTQAEALDILKLGHNAFLTGPAGSGKTYLLNQFIKYLRLNNVSVGITASTGIAATHMGGTTIHSWSGMGIRDEMDERAIADLLKRQYLRKHFLKTKVLIIDEISMLHAFQLDLVHSICRAFKKIEYPFGGMQVVMCGDFFQLPPVSKADGESRFVTDSTIWNEMKLRICYLDEQYRQSDRAFLRVLNDIRSGDVNEDTVEVLSERLNKEPEGYTRPTRLFTHNADVDVVNKTHLDALVGEAHEYRMIGRGNPNLVEVLRKTCLAPEKLILKKGAQVMFVKNNYEVGYVNGTLGEVIGFDKVDAPIVRTFDGAEIAVSQMSWEVKEENTELAAISQVPLRLAWAITVHKSQGMSLDAAEVDLSRSFVPGQGYVALSRLRGLKGLKLMGMNQMALTVNSDVAEMDREFRRLSDEAVLDLQKLDLQTKEQKQKDYLHYLQR
ncbi:MAG: PIF1 family DEAD/DEAH box helicase [Patescibacteria group bacterium]